MKEIKDFANSNFISQNAKIVSLNQKIFSLAAGYRPCFAQEIIAKLLCDDNSNAETLLKNQAKCDMIGD